MQNDLKETRADFDEVAKLAYARFGSLSTFTGVDVGFRYVNGEATETLAVRVHVSKKRAASELAATDILPRELNGLPIDVLETQPVVHRGPGRPGDRHAILAGGMSVGREHGPAGTISAIVIDNQTNRPAVLSNAHVLAGHSSAPGDLVLQPGDSDASDTVAHLTRSILNWHGDAAIASLTNARAWLPMQYASKGFVNTVRAPHLGEALVKQGRSKEGVFGRIDGEGIYRIHYEVAPGHFAPYDISGFMIAQCEEAGDSAQGGDSGALWVGREDRAAVGLHMAGTAGPRVISCHLPRVLDALDVRLASFEDLFFEAERLDRLACDPRGPAYDKYFAPMNDFRQQAPAPVDNVSEYREAGRCLLLEDPRDLPAMMPVGTMPDCLYLGVPYGFEDEDMTLGAIWQRLIETLQAEGYMLDPHVSPNTRIRDLIDTDYPEYVFAGIIEASRHFAEWFDPQPTGAFYKSCETLGEVCKKLAALNQSN